LAHLKGSDWTIPVHKRIRLYRSAVGAEGGGGGSVYFSPHISGGSRHGAGQTLSGPIL